MQMIEVSRNVIFFKKGDDMELAYSKNAFNDLSISFDMVGVSAKELINALDALSNLTTVKEVQLFYGKPVRRHRKKRINKKWNKKYGIKYLPVQSDIYDAVVKTDNKTGQTSLKFIESRK